VIFLLKDLPKVETERGLCISYTPVLKDACFNATLLGGEILAKTYYLNGNEELKNKAKQIIDFVVSYQLPTDFGITKWILKQERNLRRQIFIRDIM
jgi:hypothetical protein